MLMVVVVKVSLLLLLKDGLVDGVQCVQASKSYMDLSVCGNPLTCGVLEEAKFLGLNVGRHHNFVGGDGSRMPSEGILLTCPHPKKK